MLDTLVDLFLHSLVITGFVAAMMLLIEYVNVLTQGTWQQRLAAHQRGQLILAAFLGGTPGCLGAFAVVAMYSHGVVRLGAVVAAMVATSGDEAFVMLAMIPGTFGLLATLLFVIGIIAGALTDAFFPEPGPLIGTTHDALELHGRACHCFPRGQITRQWKHCTAPRGTLVGALTLFLTAVLCGQIGPHSWNWMRITLVLVSGLGLFIVSTVPDLFLEQHLWAHVARTHVPRVFLWTLGALLVMHILNENLHLDNAIRSGRWIVLLVACLVGLIPESGPHLVFVTLYAHGTIPFSILLASSIVQDGHGMLPMLADSRRGFVLVKLINLAIGAVIGGAALLAGY